MLGRNMLISKIAFILALLVVDIVSAKLTAADLSKSLAKLRSYSLQQTRGIRTNPEDTANLKKQLPRVHALYKKTHKMFSEDIEGYGQYTGKEQGNLCDNFLHYEVGQQLLLHSLISRDTSQKVLITKALENDLRQWKTDIKKLRDLMGTDSESCGRSYNASLRLELMVDELLGGA